MNVRTWSSTTVSKHSRKRKSKHNQILPFLLQKVFFIQKNDLTLDQVFEVDYEKSLN